MRRAAGFTIIEIVVTILVSSILAVGVIGYIADAVTGITATGNRNQLASSGRTVVDRLALELHNSVPNSVRVTAAQPNGDQCLEFIPFRGATTYLDAPFTGPGGTTITAIDFQPALTLASPANVYAIIYPIDLVAVYTAANPGPTKLVDSIVDTGGPDGKVTLTLSSSHRFNRRSPVDRLYVADQPVSFCLTGGQLFRYKNYGYQVSQCTPATPACLPAAAPDRVLISQNIDNTGLQAFRISPPTLRRNAIIAFDFNFTSNTDVVQLTHEVMLRNVP